LKRNRMPKADAADREASKDPWIRKFRDHLETDKGASKYTRRNYLRTLEEFETWRRAGQGGVVNWRGIERDQFRGYLRHLGSRPKGGGVQGSLSRAFIQLQFSALRTFYRFLMREGVVQKSPIKNLSLPKREKRLPKYLTKQQMEDLLAAPLK